LNFRDKTRKYFFQNAELAYRKMNSKIIEQSVARMQSSTAIPHYQSIKPKVFAEEYLLLPLNHPQRKLIVQIRLNYWAITINGSRILLNDRCPLCGNPQSSAQHLMLECPHLIPERNFLLTQFPESHISQDARDTLNRILSTKLTEHTIESIFKYWINVTNLFKLSD